MPSLVHLPKPPSARSDHHPNKSWHTSLQFPDLPVVHRHFRCLKIKMADDAHHHDAYADANVEVAVKARPRIQITIGRRAERIRKPSVKKVTKTKAKTKAKATKKAKKGTRDTIAKSADIDFDTEEMTIAGFSQCGEDDGFDDGDIETLFPAIVSVGSEENYNNNYNNKTTNTTNNTATTKTKLPPIPKTKLPPIPIGTGTEDGDEAFFQYFDSEHTYHLTQDQREDIRKYILSMRGPHASSCFKAFREKAIKNFFALKFLVETAGEEDEELKAMAIRLQWESYLPFTHEMERPIAAAITMLCSGATNDKRLLNGLREWVFESGIDYSAPCILAKGESWVCQLLENCGIGKQNKCAKYIVETAASIVANHGLERDYRRLKLLKGFGPKTALITIQAAYGLTQGIGVDVHVARILGALEWSVYKSSSTGTNYEEVIRACAEAILWPDAWVSVNNTCGALGQLLRNERTSKKLLQLASTLASNDMIQQFDVDDFRALRKIALEYETFK